MPLRRYKDADSGPIRAAKQLWRAAVKYAHLYSYRLGEIMPGGFVEWRWAGGGKRGARRAMVDSNVSQRAPRFHESRFFLRAAVLGPASSILAGFDCRENDGGF